MLDFSKYQSIGAALKDALDEFANAVGLIESDRDREKECLTCRDFKLRLHAPAGGFVGDGNLATSAALVVSRTANAL